MYNFQHLDPVSFTQPKTGKQRYGFVYTNPQKRTDLTKVFYDDGEFVFCPMGASENDFFEFIKCKPAELEQLPKHTQAIRQRIRDRFLFKKGMCAVIRDDGNKEVRGRVIKGGRDTLKIASGINIYSVAAYYVDHIDLPDFGSPLDRYVVTDYQYVSGHDDSQPMVAKIRDGKTVIAHASDDGWGGGIMIHRELSASKEDFELFEKTVSDVAKAATNGMKMHSSVTDLWVHWDWNYRPTNQSFESYMAQHARELASYRKAASS